jgi:hypothetical protein
MKKILFACGAALIGIAGHAQQQQNNESNQYRRTDDRPRAVRWEIDTTTAAHDTVWFDAQGNKMENAEEASRSFRQNTDMNRNADQRQDSLQQDVEDETRKAQQNIRNEQDSAASDLNRQPERSGNEIEKKSNNFQDEANRKEREVNQRTDSDSASGNTTVSSAQSTAGPNIEVVEDKEGPENQVVYKYQGELWYVDRKEGKMVKAKEADLIDVKHELKIHEGTASHGTRKAAKKSRG